MIKFKFLPFIFLFLDIILIAVHLWLGDDYVFFNINEERNLPTIYQGFKIILVASFIMGHIFLISKIKKELSDILFTGFRFFCFF